MTSKFAMQHLIFLIFISLCSPAVAYAEDFFPIGIFSVGPENLEIVKDAGFNTIHSYLTDPLTLEKYIQTAEKVGIKMLLYPADRADKGNFDRRKVRQFIEKQKNTKSILAWFIADEPELNNGSPEQIKEVHDFVKNLDRNRPTSIVIHRSDRYGQYKDASDVLMVDRYPVPKTPLNHIAETTRWAVNQKGDTGPVWAVIQAFGFQNEKLKGWGLREPTYDEMRAMTFLSIIYGAKGIFYFTFTGSQYRIMESREHWNDLKRIVRELNGIYPLLLVPTVPHYNAPGWPDYGHVKVDIIEGPQRDDRGLLPVHMAEKQLMKDTGEFTAGKYYIVANSTDEKVKAKFSFASASQRNNTIAVLGEGRSLSAVGRTFSDTLRPYEIHIYRTKNF